MPAYVFPDPNDRTPNNPAVIVESDKILGLYNRHHPDDENMERVVQKVRAWFDSEAKNIGWDEVKFTGNQCFLLNKKVEDLKKD